jgi:hypothetical protein
MLPRLLQVSAAGGPAARSAPVATTLPGDAAAVFAAVSICQEIRAPLLLIAQVRSAKSQPPLFLSLCWLMRRHCHLSAPLPAISPAPSPNSNTLLLLQLFLCYQHYLHHQCHHHHQDGLAACSAIGDMILRGNAGAMHAVTGIW